MFEEIWRQRSALGMSQAKTLAAQLVKIEAQAAQFLDRIVETNVPSVIAAYEERVRKLEEQKLLLRERIAEVGRPKTNYLDTLRTALDFLSSPWKLWASAKLEHRRTVLKLTFADRLRYARNEGFRTASLSLPFNVLSAILGEEKTLVGPEGNRLARLFYVTGLKPHRAPNPTP